MSIGNHIWKQRLVDIGLVTAQQAKDWGFNRVTGGGRPTLHLVLRLRSGTKKRKKKTYTKPKKIKHRHKKVKLAVLQFYKVDDAGRVQRLSKECPNAECGAGTFIANHFDSHYYA
ncbi:hypothetical protein ACFX2G_035947 [Malus domestica]